MRFARAIRSQLTLGAILCFATLFSNISVQAATISYPNLGPLPSGISFTDISETSGTDPGPLYGPPSAFTTGLDFDPQGFVAQAVGGTGDFTDGQLNFTISGAGGINNISINEGGDYEVTSLGTAQALVRAFVYLSAAVTQVNGVNVAPINLTASQASFSDLSPPTEANGWTLGTSLNVASQLGPNQRATRIEVAIDNRLTALSQSGSMAFIAKKQFTVSVGTVPEPGTLSLVVLALGLVGTAMARRER